MRIQKLFATLSALSLPIAGYTCSATWVGALNADWSVNTNWSPNTCTPGFTNPTGDTALINNGGQAHLLSPINLLSVQFQGSASQVCTVNNGGTITFQDPGSNVTILSSTSLNAQFLGSVIFNINTDLNINGNNNILLFSASTINNATLTYANLGSNSSAVRMSNLNLTSSTIQSQNNNPQTGVPGNAIRFTLGSSSGSINAGGNLTNQNQSGGTINNANGRGTTLNFNGTSASPNLILNGGAITNENAANIGAGGAGAAGSQITFNNTNTVGLSVTSGTVTNSNTGNVTGIVGTASFGSLMLFGNALNTAINVSFNITGGTVTNNNTGTVTNGFGSLIQVVNTSAAINIGSPGGTLINNDTVQGHVNITTGGTLSGIGLYTGFNNTTPGPATATVVTNTSGNVLPNNGTTPGTMTINGTYNQGASGTYTADLLNATTFSKLNVLGTANIAGNLVVDFLPGNTVSAANTFTLLEATTLAGSQFTTTYQNLPSNLIPTITYTFEAPGTVVLSFTAIPTPATLPTTYAGGFLDTVLSGINHINSHITIRMEDLRRRFRASICGNTIVRNNLRSENLIASNGNQFLALNPEVEEKQELQRRQITSQENKKPWSFYFGPIGRAFGEIHGRDEQPGARFWSVGGLVGFDYAFSQVGVGLLADYERIYSHVKEHWGKITVDEFQASAYITYASECLPELAIYGIAGGAYELYHIRRNTTSTVAKGKPHGFAYDGLLGIEYALGMCNFHFIPLANAQYIYLRAESYNEHGAGSFDINVRSQHIKSLRSSLGFRLNYYYEKCNIKFIPEIYGEWQREYLNKQRHVGITPLIAGVAGGTLLMPGSGRNIVLGGIDLLLTMYDRFEVEANYETEYNRLYHDHFFYVGAGFRF